MPSRLALDSLNLKVSEAECVGVIGPEGSGKSTLLHVLDALLEPDAGVLLADERDVWKDHRSLPEMRKRIGLCFQFSEQQFVCDTVESEILMGMCPSSEKEGQEIVRSALLELGLLPERFLNRSPSSLSIGEARRLALASLLSRGPDVLLLDEPTSGLDGDGVARVLRFLRKQRDNGTTMIIVSHDLDLLAEVVSRVVVLAEGAIVADKLVADILSDGTTLRRHGYDLPEVVQLSRELQVKGRLGDRELYKEEDLRTALGTPSS